MHFWEPLLADVLEGGGGGDGEADQEDVGLGVRKWAETIVILLPGSIEEAESVRLVADPRGEVSMRLWMEVAVFGLGW